MERPIIHSGKPFDWETGAQCGLHAVDDKGNVNWKAAMFADPGVMKCPGCDEFLWREGIDVECPLCHHKWTVR